MHIILFTDSILSCFQSKGNLEISCALVGISEKPVFIDQWWCWGSKPVKNWNLLSQLSVKICNIEIHTFWGSEQFMETAISIGSP